MALRNRHPDAGICIPGFYVDCGQFRPDAIARVSPTKVRKVPQDSCQLPGRKEFSAIPELPRWDLVLVSQFWRLDSDRILKRVLREIILSQEIQMPPGGPPPHGRWPATIPPVWAGSSIWVSFGDR
jgi:hypothetical protein